jgi:hypothetical protein
MCQRQWRRCQPFLSSETAKFVKRVVPSPAPRDRLGLCPLFQESPFSWYARRYRDWFLSELRCFSVPPMLLKSIGHEWDKSCAAEVSVWAGEQSGPTVLRIQPSGTKLPAPPLEADLIPANNRLGLNRSQRKLPARPEPPRDHPERPFRWSKTRQKPSPLRDRELLESCQIHQEHTANFSSEFCQPGLRSYSLTHRHGTILATP